MCCGIHWNWVLSKTLTIQTKIRKNLHCLKPTELEGNGQWPKQFWIERVVLCGFSDADANALCLYTFDSWLEVEVPCEVPSARPACANTKLSPQPRKWNTKAKGEQKSTGLSRPPHKIEDLPPRSGQNFSKKVLVEPVIEHCELRLIWRKESRPHWINKLVIRKSGNALQRGDKMWKALNEKKKPDRRRHNTGVCHVLKCWSRIILVPRQKNRFNGVSGGFFFQDPVVILIFSQEFQMVVSPNAGIRLWFECA